MCKIQLFMHFFEVSGRFITKKDVLCGSIVLKFLIFPVVVVVIM